MRRDSSRGSFALFAVAFVVFAVSIALAGSAQAPATPPAEKPTSAGQGVASKTNAAAPAGKTKPATAPITTLDLAVTDTAAKPVEGAFVMALPVRGGYRPSGELATDKARTTVTGRDGRAKLESLPPGPWNVSIHARGFAAQSLKRVASGPLAVRLGRGEVVTGVVRDGDARRPVAGARVEVVDDGPLPSAWSHEAARNETVTDAAGRFRLEGIGRSR